MLRGSRLLIALLLMLAGAMPVAAQQPATPEADQPKPVAAAPALGPVDTSYVLGAGDVVEVALVGRGDFAARARIGTDGFILLPLVGKVKASDRTVLELADDIRKALIDGGYYKEAIVRAEVVGISSRYVTVLGFVGSPGLVTLDRAYRLSEILARVGGRSGAGANYVLLTRAAGGDPEKYFVADLASGGASKDPVVASGDKIYVPSAESEVAYLSGEVHSPGSFPVRAGMTFRTAIAQAGGVTENGSENKITVMRAGKKLRGVKLDDPVQVGDVITIGERLF